MLFRSSVSTSAARIQELSINPQKLAGQCAKLKCCLNYEVDAYIEAQKKLPSREVPLETKEGLYYHFKTDIFSGMMTYSMGRNSMSGFTTIHKDRVYEIINLNRKGIKPDKLITEAQEGQAPKELYGGSSLNEDSITRFDDSVKNKPKQRKRRRKSSVRRRNKNNQNRNNPDNSNQNNPAKVPSNKGGANNHNPNKKTLNRGPSNRGKGNDKGKESK